MKLIPPPDHNPPLEIKVVEWVKATKDLKFREYNERPWGSYDLAFSFDGHEFMFLGRSWGWGWTNQSALAHRLTEWLELDNFMPQVERFIGEQNMNELRSLKGK